MSLCNVANDEHRTAKRRFLFNSLPGQLVQISDSCTSILNSPHRKEKTQKLNTTFYFSPFTGWQCSILPTPDIWMNGWQIIVYFNALRITLQVSIYGNWCINPCSTKYTVSVLRDFCRYSATYMKNHQVQVHVIFMWAHCPHRAASAFISMYLYCLSHHNQIILP